MKEKSFGSYLLPVLAATAMMGVSEFAAAVPLNSGWTLVGNGRNAVIDVASTFGTTSAPVTGITTNITTVWKWDPINAKWAFFTPTMDLNSLATYSASKGYAVLKSILPGEGYWVNAKNAVTLPDPVGQPFLLNKWNLTGGWNLVSTGANATAAAFATSIAPFTATTVWAWDPVSAGWYFYTPTMDANTLANYITSKGYKNFTPALADGLGFWVNRAAITGSPTASLPALDQAKQMFAELRTTVNSWVDTAKTGALNDQLTRMSNDIQANPQGGAQKTVERASVLNKMVSIYEAAKAYTASNTNGLLVGPDVNGAGFYLVSYGGFPYASIYTGGSSSYCWADSATSASVTKITCIYAGTNSFDGMYLKTVKFVLTQTSANNYSYTATRYDLPVINGQFGLSIGVPDLTRDSLGHSFPVGTGSVSKTVAGNATTGITFNGTLPPAGSAPIGVPSPIGMPPSFDGTYTNSFPQPGESARTDSITVTGSSVVGHQAVTIGASSITIDWTGTITRSPTSPNQGAITGSGTINYQGARNFMLGANSSITVNNDGSVSVLWTGTDSVLGSVAGATYRSSTGPDSGAETVAISMARSALPTANTYRYALSGSVVIPGLVSPADVTVLDPNKVVTLSLDAGSYVDLDETNSATTGSKPLAVNFVGTVQTLASRFNGSVLARSFMNDADGLHWAPTDVTAVGTFADTSAGGVGTILSGTLTSTVASYGSYHSMQPPSATNYKHAVINLTNGALHLPSRPVLGLTLTGTTTGPGANTISGQYTYDNGLVISLSGTHDGNNPANNSTTITNQDGITVVAVPNIGNSPISKTINQVTTSLGYISNGIINYTDQTFESLK